jgi:hypothetical protein
MPFARSYSPRSISFPDEDYGPTIEDGATVEIPAMRAVQFREDETTLIDVLSPRRRGPRMPPKPHATTEFALPSVIVQADPVMPTAIMIPRRAYGVTRRIDLRDLETPSVLGPRTSGVLLGALAVAAGVVMLNVLPLLGPLFDAMTR